MNDRLKRRVAGVLREAWPARVALRAAAHILAARQPVGAVGAVLDGEGFRGGMLFADGDDVAAVVDGVRHLLRCGGRRGGRLPPAARQRDHHRDTMTTKAPPAAADGALLSPRYVLTDHDAHIVTRRGRQHP